MVEDKDWWASWVPFWKAHCDLCDAEYRDRLGNCWSFVCQRLGDRDSITVVELLDACEVFQVMPGAILEAVEISYRAKQTLSRATIDADQGETKRQSKSPGERQLVGASIS